MKKIIRQMAIGLFLMLFPIMGLSQETLKIGGESTTTKHYPLSLFYKNSISQVIYTKEELAGMKGSMITALTYTLIDKPTIDFSTVQVQVYIAKTELESFETPQFIKLEGMEQVAMVQLGTFESTSLTLPLDNPYLYDGTSNLIVTIIRRNTGTVTQNKQYQCFDNGTSGETVKKQTLFAQTDNNELNVEDISTINFSALSTEHGTIRPITTFTYEQQSENAVLKLAPKTLDFGWQRAGQTAQLPFKVANPGKQTLTISSVTIPEGLGSITPDPTEQTVDSKQEKEFTFILTDKVGTYNQDVVFNATDAEPNTENLHISALVYPQDALLENFEDDALPIRFRNRTGKCVVKTGSGISQAYSGNKYIEFDQNTADTLIFPKLKGSVYMYLKANSTSSPTISILRSSDLQQWSEIPLDITLSTNYQQVKFDLGAAPTYFAVAGKYFSLDYALITEPVYPTHDLNFVSWEVPSVLNEKTEAVFQVVVSNWGLTEETVVLELLDQNNIVLAQKTGGTLAPNAKAEYTIEWTPAEANREITSLQCRIVLENDEDLTNQYSPVESAKVVPYLPVSVLNPKEVYFNHVALEQDKVTVNVRLSNTGIAPLEVSAVSVSAPFSIDVSAPFTVAAGEYKELAVSLERTDGFTGVQAASVEITSNEGTLNIPLAGSIVTEKTLLESFEGSEWLPLGWRKLGSAETTTGWRRNEYGAKEGSWYVEQNTVPDTLVTPKLNVNTGDKLLFWAKEAGAELSVLYSADLKNWNEIQQYGSDKITYSWQGFVVEFPQAGEFYVGFAASRGLDLDYIQGPEIVVVEKDLRIVGIPVCPEASNKYADISYEVYVQNIGSLKAEDYKVQLMQGDKVLAEQEGVAVDYLDTARIQIVYLPLEEGLMEDLYMKVVYEGDADPENNVSAKFNLLVRPEFYGETVVGTEKTSSSELNGLWSSYYKYTLAEFHLTEEQLEIKAGSKITSISYAVTNQSNDLEVPLKIWLGEKTQDKDINDGWSNPSDLILAYENTTTVPKAAVDEIGWEELTFTEPYLYEGGDLVIMVERQYVGDYKGISFVVNKPTENCRRYYQSDAEGSTLETSLASSGTVDKVYPTLKFVYEVPSVKVTGTVKDESGEAVEDALVSLVDGDVVYYGKTNADGVFTFEISRMGVDYKISITKEGLFFAAQTVSVGTEDIDLGEFEMIRNPHTISLALNGGEGLPLNGLKAEMHKAEGAQIYTATSTVSGTIDTLVFENLKQGLYTGKLTHIAYKDASFEIELTDKDTVLDIQLAEKDPIAVSGKVLSSINNKGLAGAAVCLEDLTYGIKFADTTDAEGNYGMDVKVAGKYLRTITALSHRKSTDTVNITETAGGHSLGDVTLRLENIIVTIKVSSSGDLTGAVAVLTDNADAENHKESALVAGNMFVFDNLLPGVYTLKISKGEDVLYTDEAFEILTSRSEEITIKQADEGTLTVKVSTDNGDSPAGAEIYLMNEYSGITYDEWVDNTGERIFTGLAFGLYRFGVYKDGFVSYEEMLNFTKDSVVSIELKENRIAPYALTAEVVYNTDDASASIEMEWNNIGDYYYDSFEDYEDFSIEATPWTLIDVDGRGTASIRNTQYPHLGEPVAAMVFNPYTTTPPCTNPVFAPLTGAKYLAFFNSVGGPSDDWAIAPKRMIRKGDRLMISFRHLEEGASPERFTVCISTTGTDPKDFMVVSSGNYIASQARWMTFQGDMSSFAGEEVHVAIHYISDQTGGMLMIDDFFIGNIPENAAAAGQVGKWLAKAQEETQYKVYLDGQFKESVKTTNYTFSNVEPGVHTVGVSQVYKGGESSITTAEVEVVNLKENAAKWELHLSTNTGVSCQEAQVSLTDSAGNSTIYTVNSDNKVIVNYLRYGTYNLKVNLADYDPVSQNLTHLAATVTEIELKESLTVPSNLFVDIFKEDDAYFGVFSWNTLVGFNEGFESYADFTRQIGQWMNIDRDGLPTFGVSNCTFPGMGEPLAAVVYNPSATSPATDGDNNVRPHSGKKEVAFFSTDKGSPNDWLISPKQSIRDNYQLRFFAKSYTSLYGLESIAVLVSQTDTAQSSFTPLRQITSIPDEWTEYVVDLSEYRGKDIYIAFRYTQANTFFLLLDDVYIGPATDVKNAAKKAISYNVYLDGKLAGTVTDAEFVFKNLEEGRTYEAGVEAVYASGASERAVYSFKVEDVSTEQAGSLLNAISVYPNPVRSGSELHVAVQTDQEYTIRFFNAYGRLVWETGQMRSFTQTIQLPVMPSGMYVMEVQTQDGVWKSKLVVL